MSKIQNVNVNIQQSKRDSFIELYNEIGATFKTKNEFVNYYLARYDKQNRLSRASCFRILKLLQ